ncbi:hypothetical protein C8Q79DRAFT_928180 [Trametes meyenii]|nr:hypothetical protein C8Q79DRAFT_928180 [Trametes meyenii]
MVFTRLTPQDKDAFFTLLDELSTRPSVYFASRPELFGNGNGGGDGEQSTNGIPPVSKAAAVSAVSHAFSAVSRASEPASASGPGAPPATNGWKRPDAAATAEIGSSVGRVAAAAAALRAQNGGEQLATAPAAANAGFPRMPPRRNTSSSNEEAAAPPPEHNKLVAGKKFGDVDMSSGKNMFSSLRHSTAAKHATPAQVAPPTPPAFQRKNDFAPPPRRVPSTGSTARASVTPSPAPAPPPVPRRAQQEPEESGEWAEALYEYHSEDPGDLDLEEGVRVLIVEKTSDDWWTGEIEGRRGLVPAAYVKML